MSTMRSYSWTIEHVAAGPPKRSAEEVKAEAIAAGLERQRRIKESDSTEPWLPGRAQVQADLIALRLTSTCLCRLATPYFYSVIQLSHPAHKTDLLAQLQAQPRLCDRTRAIWYDLVAEHANEALEASAVRFANVDEVAYCFMLEHEEVDAYPVGVHYALRDVGPWCEPVSFQRPAEPVERIQRPLVSAHDIGHASDANAQSNLSRAIWAAHVVLPGLCIYEDLDAHVHLWQLPRTITHLTITLYCREGGEPSPFIEPCLYRLFNPSNMPLLEYVDVRVSNMGQEETEEVDSDGEVDREDDQFAQVAFALNLVDERRGYCHHLYDAHTPPSTLLENVRNYTLHQWQERVFHGRTGPWRYDPTSVVRPQVMGGLDGTWDLGPGNDFDYKPYAPDADFNVNKPDYQDLVRRSWFEGQPLHELADKDVEDATVRIRNEAADRLRWEHGGRMRS